MKKLLTAVSLCILFGTGLALADFDAGDSSCSFKRFRVPIFSWLNNSRSVYCIDSSEISVGEDQTMTGIGWYWCDGGAGTRDLDVYLLESSGSCPSYSSSPGDLTAEGFTQVADDQVLNFSSGFHGWKSVNFNLTDFDYHVGNNLIVVVCTLNDDDLFPVNWSQSQASATSWSEYQDEYAGGIPCLDFSQAYGIAHDNDFWPATYFHSHPVGGPTNTPSPTPTPCYCFGSGGGDEYISGVEMGSISNTGTGSDGYMDYTAMSTTLLIGIGDTITVTNGNPYSSDICTVWVDWNQDLDWDDPGEQVLQGYGYGPYTGPIVPPPSALIGPTRMRIRIEYQEFTGPCGIPTFGEVEDYTVVVQNPSETPTPPTYTPTSPPTFTPSPPTYTSTPNPTNTLPPPTYTPTSPPTYTSTPNPTNTLPPSTYTPAPTSVPPTSTPECSTLGCEVYMPNNDFAGGDECFCDVYICNPNPETYYDVPIFVILDVYGTYHFAPSYSGYDYYTKNITTGRMTIHVLDKFIWPYNAGTGSGIIWYAAMTNQSITELLGDYGTFTFSWH